MAARAVHGEPRDAQWGETPTPQPTEWIVDGTGQEILRELRALAERVDRLDIMLRGNNGDGITVRIAQIRTTQEHHAGWLTGHGEDIDDLRQRQDSTERRVAWYAGGAAAIGAFAGLLVELLLSKWL